MQNVPKGDDAGNAPAPLATWRELAAGVAAALDTLGAFRRALDDSQRPLQQRKILRAQEILHVHAAATLRALEVLMHTPTPEACGAALLDVARSAHALGRVGREVPRGGDVPPTGDATALAAHRSLMQARLRVATIPLDPERPSTEHHKRVNVILRAAEVVDGVDAAERRAAVAFLMASMHPDASGGDHPDGFFAEGLVVARHQSKHHKAPGDAVKDALDLVGFPLDWNRVQALKSKRHVRVVRKGGKLG
jgi:hypothetical protein